MTRTDLGPMYAKGIVVPRGTKWGFWRGKDRATTRETVRNAG
jgi:hypothetical protein